MPDEDSNLGDLFVKMAQLPENARNQIVKAAQDGKPQLIDPKGSGMTGREIATVVEMIGNAKSR